MNSVSLYLLVVAACFILLSMVPLALLKRDQDTKRLADLVAIPGALLAAIVLIRSI